MADDTFDFDEENASALAEMLADPVTSENVRIQIIQSLLEEGKDITFFETMFKEAMSLAACTFCGHENHWLIPEDELNQMGWVSYEQDNRVPRNPSKKDCREFQEACAKKKTTA
jgi:hypothetical protein